MGEDVTARDLPERVRARVVQVVADALPVTTDLPSPLRRVAEFAPARRARLGSAAIVAALADDDFRSRAATQVAARQPQLAAAPDSPDDHDPAEVGAAAWLLRPDGWEQLLADAVRRLADSLPADPAVEAEVTRLRRQVEGLQRTLSEVRAAQKDKVDGLKAENTTLRHKVGDLRQSERSAQADRTAAETALRELRATAEQAATRADAELRRLRAQVEELSADRSAQRKETRSQRDTATLRARLLLDTVVDAATGLRRELGLPAVTGAPADELEATLDRPSAEQATARPATPAALEQLLSLPRARLVVDGYNVSKTAWPSSTLEAQRTRLVQALAPLVARTGAETTVVFDAAAVSARPVMSAPRGVRVVFSPEGVIADDVIRDLVSVEPEGRVVVVVSSDQQVMKDVARVGARAVPAASLVALVTG